ncbi:DUF2513 domain-containing protein [Aeromonas jandaei]|uniref:DUF2513 domain-containing protein n=1 Tax=Aeromonas jandaei TaxID=650 RepID=UPI001862ECA1|nr:DUF2513 domain-containing protein [Aeromonas jandaei]QNF14450.1 DUF2513 domain-containing protein [Aeromonas jandaei]QSR74698.1 DUF2513 domain-containing protein [Aeromonas jandaei]
MKRDWDVVRSILTKIEDEVSFQKKRLELSDFHKETFDEQYVISEHMRLLIEDAGVVRGVMNPRLGQKVVDFIATGLTFSGHEFLDSIRNDTVWNKTKETFETKGLDMTFETIKAVAAAAMTSMLGLSA